MHGGNPSSVQFDKQLPDNEEAAMISLRGWRTYGLDPRPLASPCFVASSDEARESLGSLLYTHKPDALLSSGFFEDQTFHFPRGSCIMRKHFNRRIAVSLLQTLASLYSSKVCREGRSPIKSCLGSTYLCRERSINNGTYVMV